MFSSKKKLLSLAMKNFVDSSRPLKKAKTYKEREDVSIQLAATEMHLGFLRHM